MPRVIDRFLNAKGEVVRNLPSRQDSPIIDILDDPLTPEIDEEDLAYSDLEPELGKLLDKITLELQTR